MINRRISRPKIAKSIEELIGNTPLLELENINKGLYGKIIAKLESFNPLSSVKDRIGSAMIKDAEDKGILKPGFIIIEPTSGNTGIALAFICAKKGYRLILTMPDTMSIERRKLLKFLGADVVLTPGAGGMSASIDKAYELQKQIPNSVILKQFENSSNPEIHRKTTAVEIWEDTDGKIDFLVAGIGTGGTITGTSEILKKLKPSLKTIAVEPAESAVLSGGKPGSHKIQGIGAGFIPKVLNMNIIDEIITVKSNDAGNMLKILAKTEGVVAGISSGAALYAAHQIAGRIENKEKIIVVILPDTGERYISTWLFDDE